MTPELAISAYESRIERISIRANLRHHEIEPCFNERSIALGLADFPWRDELHLLWQLANACEARRGKPSATPGQHDYVFQIDGDLSDADACRVDIKVRERGSPLDKLVAELMIVANSTWGALLAEKGIAAIYRAQSSGKVRMTTTPLPHEGLGVAQYAWMSSPLRRYVDLLNQWQLVACLNGTPPFFGQRETPSQGKEKLFAALRDFELRYSAYAEFQRSMERYWCLRWLQQEQLVSPQQSQAEAQPPAPSSDAEMKLSATLRRDNLVKFDHLPILQRVPSVPDLAPGQRLHLRIASIDLLNLDVDCRYVGHEALQDAAQLDADEDNHAEQAKHKSLDSTEHNLPATPELAAAAWPEALSESLDADNADASSASTASAGTTPPALRADRL